MQCVKDASAASLMPFVEESVESGSVVVTDDWAGYDPLKKKDYQRRIITIKHHREPASELLPRTPGDLTTQALAAWHTPRGGHHEHLDYYLDEFVFRTGAAHAVAASSAGAAGRQWSDAVVPRQGGRAVLSPAWGHLSQVDTQLIRLLAMNNFWGSDKS